MFVTKSRGQQQRHHNYGQSGNQSAADPKSAMRNTGRYGTRLICDALDSIQPPLHFRCGCPLLRQQLGQLAHVASPLRQFRTQRRRLFMRRFQLMAAFPHRLHLIVESMFYFRSFHDIDEANSLGHQHAPNAAGRIQGFSFRRIARVKTCYQ